MNQRDLPKVVADLIYEMHEVRSELQAINGRLDRLDNTMSQAVSELRAMPDQIGTSVMRALAPYLNKILDHDQQLKSHAGRLNTLENPSA